jgi:hypothetical protein
LQIDLNNDGVNDFTLTGDTSCPVSTVRSYLNVKGVAGSDRVVAFKTITGRDDARALKMGNAIGSNAKFSNYALMQSRLDVPLANRASVFATSDYSFGSFVNTVHSFLGMRFLLNGQTHYGWIGFRSTSEGNATLGGWAYETEPNNPIAAGEGGEVSDSALLTIPPEPRLCNCWPWAIRAYQIGTADSRHRLDCASAGSMTMRPAAQH